LSDSLRLEGLNLRLFRLVWNPLDPLA
jgi:hypothetical protein